MSFRAEPQVKTTCFPNNSVASPTECSAARTSISTLLSKKLSLKKKKKRHKEQTSPDLRPVPQLVWIIQAPSIQLESLAPTEKLL